MKTHIRVISLGIVAALTVLMLYGESDAQSSFFYLYPPVAGTYTSFGEVSGSGFTRHDVLHWENAVNIPWRLNQSGAGDGLSFAQTQSALAAAFLEWQNVSTAYIGFTYAGSTSNKHNNSDGQNVLFWAEGGDQAYTTGYYGTVMDRGLLALTIITVNSSQEILDVDIVFNGRDLTWRTEPFEDIQSIATHEIGHLLGLGHYWGFVTPVPTMISGTTVEPGFRTLELPDKDAVTFLYKQTLLVPGDFSSVSAALSDAVSGSGQTVIVSGTQSIQSNLTVKTGNTLQLNSGTTFTFSGSSTKLLVNGSVTGPYGNAVLQGNGAQGSWYGIEMNSSGGSAGGCTIRDAYYGISLINSSSTHSGNHLQNNRYGVNCVNYSSPALIGDVLQENGWAVAGDNTCLPYMGSSGSYPGLNSFRDNDFYDVYSAYAGTVYARGNWWGASPPYPSVTQNVDYQEWLSYDPNPRGQSVTTELVGLQFSKGVTSSSSQLISPGIVSTPEPGMSELNSAYLLYVDGKYAQALQAFETIVAGYPDNFAGRRALVFVERTLDKLGRSSDILATLNSASASYTGKALGEFAEARRVYQYINQGRYQDAATQAAEIVRLNDDTTLVKFALYDLGSIYWYYLGDTKTGEQYYRQLIARFPKDHLTNSALATLGEWKPEEQSEKAGDASLGKSKEPPAQYALAQNYPNPFNPSTVISYQLPTRGYVTLKLYNALGQEVAMLVDGIQDAGFKSVMFDASRLPSGVYFYRLQSGTFVQNKKMLLVK